MDIGALVNLIFYLAIIGLIFYALWWGIGALEIPEPFAKICRVLLILVMLYIVVNLLMGFLPPVPHGRLLR